MSSRRRKPEAPAPDAARAFAVVVEEMRGHFHVFGEQLGAVREDVATLREDLTALRGDVTTLRVDLTALRGDVTTLREDLTTLRHEVTTGFARVEQDIGLLKIAVLDVNRELKSKVDRADRRAPNG